MVLQGSRIASYFNTPAALMLFFVLILVGNTAVGLLHRSWMLCRGELALIYIMWIVATAIPEFGLTQFLLPDITAIIYFATTENGCPSLPNGSTIDWRRCRPSTKACLQARRSYGSVRWPTGPPSSWPSTWP